jgi:Fe-S oxidoreductase
VRPLYESGMLDLARRMLREVLDVLGPTLRDGTPVVVLEPSCAAVFRDELPNLLPDDPRAEALARQTRLFSELLDGEGIELPRVARKALVQMHCHQHAVLGQDPERRVLRGLGLEAEVLDAGCCGMAGSFGFQEGEPYRVGVGSGELALLPAVRRAPADTIVVADGFSCRTQIEQGTGRRALHLAELVRLAAEPDGARVDPDAWARSRRPRRRARDVLREIAVAAAGGAALAGGAVLLGRRR